MRMVITVALAAVVALVVAVITGSPWPAVAVIALATTGIVLLVRGWRASSDARADQV